MAHQVLTYSVRGIFTQCLVDYHAARYLIAAYQRGYKWDSGPPTDTGELEASAQGAAVQVDKLLLDLWRAFENQPKSGAPTEYYLQFLTFKAALADDGAAVLEVIDGQQRLTTLSVLFAVLQALAGLEVGTEFSFTEIATPNATAQEPAASHISSGKLEYAVREGFLERFVYQGRVQKLLDSPSWEAFVRPGADAADAANFDRDQQDVYYLFRAARKIGSFLGAPGRRGRLRDFGNFVADRGRLIANVIEEELSSEEIFANLNSNRVPLTETELIKGLLLTYAGRQEPARSFRELQELRGAQGRHWDELAHWLGRDGVLILYGWAADDALWQVLRLVALRLTAKQADLQRLAQDAQPAPLSVGLFELFERMVRSGVAETTAGACFAELRLVVSVLRDWYDDPLVHNQLGVLQASKRYKDKAKASLLETITGPEQLAAGKPARFLAGEIGQLPALRTNLQQLSYDRPIDRDLAFDLLLLLNVFPEQAPEAHPFNFTRFSRENWSLEHLYPQHPAWAGEEPTAAELAALAELDYTLNETPTAGQAMDPEQVALLSSRRQEDNALLHTIGNLALLTSGVNSSLNNEPFASKRQRLVERVRLGSFVPPHTFSVFSKLVLQHAAELGTWTKSDIDEHAAYLVGEQQRLRDLFPLAKPRPA